MSSKHSKHEDTLPADTFVYFVSAQSVTELEPEPGWYAAHIEAQPVGPFDCKGDAIESVTYH